MTKYYLPILILLNFIGFSQNNFCGTEPSGEIFRPSTEQLSYARMATPNTGTNAVALSPFVFNVKVHFTDTSVPVAQQELKALDLVGSLNVVFNQANIFFNYKGYDSTPKPQFTNITSTSAGIIYPTNTEFIDVFVNSFVQTNNNNLLGIMWNIPTVSGEIARRFVVIKTSELPVLNNINPSNTDFGRFTLAHEIGHYLGLHHTHQRWKNNPTVVKVSDNTIDCSVNEENLNGSEWETKGDFIQDTNPDRVQGFNAPLGAFYSVNPAYPTHPLTCTIIPNNYVLTSCGTIVNFNSANGAVFNPPINNIMAYYHTCGSQFSPKQYDFMRAFIIAHNGAGQFLNNKLTTPLALYEPYSFSITESQTVNLGELNNGYATVCTIRLPKHKFQKGFTYQFYNNLPSINSISNIHQQPIIDTSIDFQLKITQLNSVSNNLLHNIFVDCWRPACTEVLYTGGKILTQQNLGSYQGTIQNLTEQQASDPNLIQNLEPQKFYTIQKTTDTGLELTKTIYKP